MDTTRASDRMVSCLMRSALACLIIAVLCGALAVLFYITDLSNPLRSIGVDFRDMRPLHTTFASAWIFLAGMTCVFHYLYDTHGEPTRSERLRFRIQMILFGLAGAGILITIPMGITSGREYIGFHPALSLLIVAGWLLFAWTFFSRCARGFWSQPVYVYMWGIGILYFLYTFAEGHAWLLPWIRSRPVADLQIQWKSCGTIVASFNMLMYGALIYLSGRIARNDSYARSPKAFVFFGIGLLNSFTNYAHHTYHLPQSHLIKWVAFVVSMLEIILLVSILNDVRAMLAARKPTDSFTTTGGFLKLAKGWSFAMLTLSLLISVPNLNTPIHGTHVVMAHAMGSEIGIDTMVLFAFFSYLTASFFPRRYDVLDELNNSLMQSSSRGLNRGLIGLILTLLIGGVTVGVTRMYGIARPQFLDAFPYSLAFFGIMVGWFLVRLSLFWWRYLPRVFSSSES